MKVNVMLTPIAIGNDTLDGGMGSDFLQGGSEDDELDGGAVPRSLTFAEFIGTHAEGVFVAVVADGRRHWNRRCRRGGESRVACNDQAWRHTA